MVIGMLWAPGIVKREKMRISAVAYFKSNNSSLDVRQYCRRPLHGLLVDYRVGYNIRRDLAVGATVIRGKH